MTKRANDRKVENNDHKLKKERMTKERHKAENKVLMTEKVKRAKILRANDKITTTCRKRGLMTKRANDRKQRGLTTKKTNDYKG